MPCQVLKTTVQICIIDEKPRILLSYAQGNPPPTWALIGTTLTASDLPLPAILNFTRHNYGLIIKPDSCRPWFFQTYREHDHFELALLYFAIVPHLDMKANEQLKWFDSHDLVNMSFSKPSSLFFPYILEVLPTLRV